MGRLTGLVLALFLEGCASQSIPLPTTPSSPADPWRQAIPKILNKYSALERQIIKDKLTPEIVDGFKEALFHYKAAEKEFNECVSSCFSAYSHARLALTQLQAVQDQQRDYFQKKNTVRSRINYGL